METSVQIIQNMVAEFSAMERVPLLNEFITEVLLSLDRVLVSTSCLESILSQLPRNQCEYHSFLATHQVNKRDPFRAEPTVWINCKMSSLPSPSSTFNPRLGPQPAPPSSMGIKPTGALLSMIIQQSQSTVQVAVYINTNVPTTTRESERALQREIIFHFWTRSPFFSRYTH